MIIGMYCDVCRENGVENDGFQEFDMECIEIEHPACGRTNLLYEGECPECGTVYQYVSFQEEVHYTFCKKGSD